jgi:hypothetical protein
LSDTYFDLMGIRPIEGTNSAASFDHMAFYAYDAQYYGYLVKAGCKKGRKN